MYGYSYWEEERREELASKLNAILEGIGKKTFTYFFEDIEERGLSFREGQADMACEIVGAMKEDKHFLCEAGVGIGKTYAYLVPLMLYWKKCMEPIVIATSTIALQDQLLGDIERINKELNIQTDIILIKGQSHYLCKGRLHDYLEVCDDDNKIILNKIDEGGSQEGDWDFDIPEKLWEKINVNNYNPKICNSCTHRSYCAYHKLRKDVIRTKGVIVCNQDLLICDLMKKSWEYGGTYSILTDNYKYVVVDEVHNIEGKVRNARTSSFGYDDFKKSIDKLVKACRRNSSLLYKSTREYMSIIDSMFGAFLHDIKRQEREAEKDNCDIEKYSVPREQMQKARRLRKLYQDIYRTAEAAAEFEKNAGYIYDALESLDVQIRLWNAFIHSESYVFWITCSKKKKEGVVLYYCPSDIASDVEEMFFSGKRIRTIMTSATITTGNCGDYKKDYAYFLKTTGLRDEACVLSEPKESPFDYDRQAIVYYNDNLVDPRKNRELFIEQGVEELVKILEITKGKALVLFTAKSDMKKVYNKLVNRIPYKIIVQDERVPQKEAISQFKSDINSVLLGTGSYWEGVSVEGVALSNLVVFKLPFPVPDPIYEKKMENCKNGLMEVLVPEMVLKLKQGIGRLIRKEGDYGIVSILDPRIGELSNAPYKSVVWDAIPIKNKTTNLDEVKNFYVSIEKK